MNARYRTAAHKRSVLAHIQRIVLDRFVDQEGPAKENIICEEVFYADRTVPQDIVLDVLEELKNIENKYLAVMRKFEMRERHGERDGDDGSAEEEATTTEG